MLIWFHHQLFSCNATFTFGNITRVVFLLCLLVKKLLASNLLDYWLCDPSSFSSTLKIYLLLFHHWLGNCHQIMLLDLSWFQIMLLIIWAFSMPFNLLMTVGAHKFRMWRWLLSYLHHLDVQEIFQFSEQIVFVYQTISAIHSTISLIGIYSKCLMSPIKKILCSQSFEGGRSPSLLSLYQASQLVSAVKRKVS